MLLNKSNLTFAKQSCKATENKHTARYLYIHKRHQYIKTTVDSVNMSFNQF